MAVTIGTGQAFVQVEYVRARAVLRLRRLAGTQLSGDVVELPLEELSRAFDIGLRAADGPARFLLFGGASQQRLGGARDLLEVYDDEGKSRVAFHARRQAFGRHGWAELVVLEGRRPPRRLCWFGTTKAVAMPNRAPAPSELCRRTLRLLPWRRSSRPQRRASPATLLK